MRARLRARRALGLRGRIVGAVLVTAVATLIVAAMALLGPLENSLRNAALKTLQQQVPRSSVAQRQVGGPSRGAVLRAVGDRETSSTARAKASACVTTWSSFERDLGARIGAIRGGTARLPGSRSGHGSADRRLAGRGSRYQPTHSTTRGAHSAGNKTSYTLGSIEGAEYVRAAIPFSVPSSTNQGRPEPWVLVVRKPIAEVSARCLRSGPRS